MVPHDMKHFSFNRNVQGLVGYEENGGQHDLVAPEGGLVEVHDDKYFESFAVCKARREQHMTEKTMEDEPLLMMWQKQQKNKLGKRCALVELELVEL
jgi:hypothetical protein